MTIMSRCCIDAESYTAELRCILESIIFPTSSVEMLLLSLLNQVVSSTVVFLPFDFTKRLSDRDHDHSMFFFYDHISSSKMIVPHHPSSFQ